MKFIPNYLGAVAIAISLQSHACSVFLQDTIQLPTNSVEISNSDRLAIARHYLTAREWTAEGASVEVDVAAFEFERNPGQLAAVRAKNLKTFLMQLGLDKNDIYVSERIIKLNNGKINPDDKWQIGIEFAPKCPPTGCDYLCNTPKVQGVPATR
ncbi:hypothetical protein [Paraburkholderia susongensis]|uniref:hypothetical protein n=1 Tax=Paraburkholderia susongensis TaxID=1515439 RepID=UPI00117D3C3D|nr:hypothetical protein [Paraburkholderia susongensis]